MSLLAAGELTFTCQANLDNRTTRQGALLVLLPAGALTRGPSSTARTSHTDVFSAARSLREHTQHAPRCASSDERSTRLVLLPLLRRAQHLRGNTRRQQRRPVRDSPRR